MNDYTTTIYVVEDRRWWAFTPEQWVAFLPLALAGMRSGQGYQLPDTNRRKRPPKCAKRIDGEDAWESDRYDAEIFYLAGWNLEVWEQESAMMQESGFLEAMKS